MQIVAYKSSVIAAVGHQYILKQARMRTFSVMTFLSLIISIGGIGANPFQTFTTTKTPTVRTAGTGILCHHLCYTNLVKGLTGITYDEETGATSKSKRSSSKIRVKLSILRSYLKRIQTARTTLPTTGGGLSTQVRYDSESTTTRVKSNVFIRNGDNVSNLVLSEVASYKHR